MNDLSKKIIPDSDAVVCLLDKAMIEILYDRDTYKAKSLFQALWELNHSSGGNTVEILEEVLGKIYCNQSNINNSALAKKIQAFVKESKGQKSSVTNIFEIEPFFSQGVECSLLQPDGKGWQKGKIKICFEFTPEETEVLETSNNLPITECYPLDEIRNSLIASN